jgi:PBP1b-binding outer membrane lipoprotein LpoB
MKTKFGVFILFILTMLTGCSSSDESTSACKELGVLITSIDAKQVETLEQFHGTVDAILIHARNAAKRDRDFAQLANKIQAFASLWYAKAGASVPTSSEAAELKQISDTYCSSK